MAVHMLWDSLGENLALHGLEFAEVGSAAVHCPPSSTRACLFAWKHLQSLPHSAGLSSRKFWLEMFEFQFDPVRWPFWFQLSEHC